MGEKFYIIVLTIPALIISLIETYTFLSYLTIPCICLGLVGLSFMFGSSVNKIAHNEIDEAPLKFFDLSAVIGHIGLAMYFFDANAIVINVRSETRNKELYPTILKLALITCLILFMTFASVTYYTFRDNA